MHVLCNPNTITARLYYVVLELFVMVDVETEPRSHRAADASFVMHNTTHYLYKRTGADALIEWLTQSGLKIGIWTHETRRRAHSIARHAFPKLKPAFVYTRRSCAVHKDVYVKDVRRLSKRSILVDFNATQIHYNVEHGIDTPILIDQHANLNQIHCFLKRRLRSQFQARIVI